MATTLSSLIDRLVSKAERGQLTEPEDTYDEDEETECPHCEGWPRICDRAYDLWADK